MTLPARFIKQHRWLIALCLSLCAHAGLLLLAGDHRLPLKTAVTGQIGSGVMTFRTLQPNAVSNDQPSGRNQRVTQITTVTEPPVLHPPPAEMSSESTEHASVGAKLEPTSQEGLHPPSFAESHYFPPTELTAKPQFVSEGDAPAPTYFPDIYPLPVVVHIYISETGTVDGVILEESFLSDVAQKFIQDSFFSMKFTPGMLGALPVKSQLTLEARLDSILQPR